MVVLSGPCDDRIRQSVQPWLDQLFENDDSLAILPVMKTGVDISQLQFWGSQMSQLNVGWWTDTVAELTPRILLLSKSIQDRFQVFISYRHLDSQVLADQIHRELTSRGFSVFLDRFNVPVAARFQDSLTHQLEDSSMLVVLETPRYDSPWTQYEVGFAQRRRMGICSLMVSQMNIGTVKNPTIQESSPERSISDRYRQKLYPKDFGLPEGQFPTAFQELIPSTLKAVADEIERLHNLAFVRRRSLLVRDLQGALDHYRLGTCKRDSKGAYLLQLPNHLVKFVLSPRPVELSNLFDGFHHEPRHSPPQTCLVLIAPHIWASPKKIAHLSWVRSNFQIAQVDPQHLYRMASQLAKLAEEA